MTDQLPERLDGDISISASIEQTGVKAAAKGRAFVAIDRLVGGAIDIVAAKVEGARDRQLIANAAQAAALQATAQRYLENMEAVPDLAMRGMGHLLREEARKQGNREAVAAAAIEQLALPPPTTSSDGAEAGEDASLDEDWLNVFSRHVESASTERFQVLWGRILAGEIRRPGSFSLTTLRVISELDHNVATLFQATVRDRVGKHIPLPGSLTGPRLAEAGLLVDAGLLQDTGDAIHMEFTPGKHFSSDNLLLKLEISKGSCDLPVIALTRAGYEIARILPYDEPRAMKRAASLLSGTFEITLCSRRPHPTEVGMWLLTPIEVLRKAGTPSVPFQEPTA